MLRRPPTTIKLTPEDVKEYHREEEKEREEKTGYDQNKPDTRDSRSKDARVGVTRVSR